MTSASVELDSVYSLASGVSLRPERFGALAYSFDTRKLSFLKHPDLVAVVRAFDGSCSVREALVGVGVEERRWPSFLSAIATLDDSAMLDRVEEERASLR
ncbi:MAG: mycofactocin biosynthesis chaperone MftB [Microthrixaceae bacterium]